ncbi:hypothetical protein [Methylophaga sp. OBS1]|nr:hypothetical protein [Methylophaga sp. OBS1]MCX4191045.1 hypothetical protein [Methylophaga sp. OBS1]MCX4192009.1 hypothetical protein [Methylophaga sp. OBS1]
MSISNSKYFKFLALVLTQLMSNGWMVGSYTGGILTAEESADFGPFNPR